MDFSLFLAEITVFKTTNIFNEKFAFDLLGYAKWGICFFFSVQSYEI